MADRMMRAFKPWTTLLAVLAVLSIGWASSGRVSAAPFVVGTLDGAAGGILTNLLANATSNLDISVVQSGTLDAAFFNQIDVFVFANGQGALSITLGATARTNLLNFVTGGGHAYMGLDAVSGVGPPFDNDGADIAALFGFSLVDRQALTETGTITDPAHPITTGPFQPADSFSQSFFGRFDGAPPSGGSIIGTAPHGNVLAYLNADALAAGSGKVYMYSDEVPLFGGASATNHSHALFQNALVDMGAMLRVSVPEPGTLAIFGVGLAGLGFARRQRAA